MWPLHVALWALETAAVMFTGAFALTARHHYRLGAGDWQAWKHAQWAAFGKRNLLIGSLVAVAAQLLLTFGAFWWLESFDAACNYGTFAFPCLAGMAVGWSLLQRESTMDAPFVDTEFRAYAGSVGLLVVGYACYLAHSASRGVVDSAQAMVALSCIVPLLSGQVWSIRSSRWAASLVKMALTLMVMAFGLFLARQWRWL